MSGSLVVDASVAVKWVLPEQGSPAARALLAQDAILLAPAFVRIEVASAVSRALRAKRISRSDCELYLGEARALFASVALTLLADDALQVEAETIAMDLSHPLKDCFLIALALREGADLITADQTLFARAAPVFPFVRAL